MSTLNALAQKHGITVPLRVSDCPKVLTIVKIDNQMLPDGQGGRVAADVLTAKAENGTAYTVRLNQVTIGQLVRIFGPDAEIEGKRVLASTFEKGRQELHRFRPSAGDQHAQETRVSAGRRRGHGADQGQDAVRPQPRSPGRHRQPRTDDEDDVVVNAKQRRQRISERMSTGDIMSPVDEDAAGKHPKGCDQRRTT